MFEKTVEIPEGVNASMDGNKLVVTGPKGNLERVFKHHIVKIEIKDSHIKVFSKDERRKQRGLVGTWTALTKNMIHGVNKEWEARLKAVYSHFPMKLAVEGDKFIIQNFLGEKAPRSAKIVEGTNVRVDREEIIITGVDREKVGQTAANIEISAKVIGFDRRVFQDGCYLVQKTKVLEDENHGN
jgi:large subunit ribosomal protein L6